MAITPQTYCCDQGPAASVPRPRRSSSRQPAHEPIDAVGRNASGSGASTLFSSTRLLAALLSLVTACAPLPSQVEKRAIVDVDDVARAISIARELDDRAQKPVPAGQPWFEVHRGTVPVIVTAPHATRPFREGQYRFADGGGTAALARALHDICDVTVLHTTFDSPSDPNFYDDNDFKAALGNLLQSSKPILVLDIHASHPFRPYEIDIGTMDGASLLGQKRLLSELVDSLHAEGLSNISHNWFAAARNQTITKYAAARGVPALQLEFSSTRVTPAKDEISAHRFAQALQALAEFLGKQHACLRREKIRKAP